ncbi:similar to Saccharomyces cerevisiae YLR278C Zinc-cluster protein [Maudiozyma saulgeensis]|uniref:Similar to Saccharomyces cerevisiae YLR278C Zinc-cluster protein n=1 Tax=Maudiozyma saulgeensis TaxID=1789683 RepID=A0A1X7R6F6_9SACH|nr:similar to Saccharomyces cerevisiae YLR278C Zinc-cluster protein [Kazachstania saulgeensis]
MGRPKKQVSEQNIENFQRDIELAGNRTDLLLKDKKGRSKSCLLCRRRKQRCDHKLPSCTACLKANVKCIQPVRYIENNGIPNTILQVDFTSSTGTSEASSNSPTPDISKSIIGNHDDNSSIATSISASNIGNISFGLRKGSISKKKDKKKTTDNNSNKNSDQYTNFLEKKLKYLEKLIDLPIGGVVFKKKLKNYKKISHLLGNIEDFRGDEMTINRINNNILPWQPSPNHSNSNNSDGHSDSNRLYGQLNSVNTEFQKQNSGIKIEGSSLPALTSDSLDSIDFSKCIFAKYLKDHFNYDPVFEFNENLSRSFLEIFFTRLQFKYPLLDEQEIYSFHNDYTKNNIYSCSANDFHFCTGRMWLIFSISAYMHMTTGKYDGLSPIRYFSTAVRHITKCGDNLNDVQKVELLTLLVLYLLRTDRDSMILYEIMKDIMAIVKGRLHLNKWTQQDSFANKKLRLFWCVYLLERMICVAVGKPFTIHESEIDVPLFNEDSYNTNKNSKTSGIHFINQSVTLRRIESNFVEKLNIIPTNKQNTPTKKNQLPTVKYFFNELEIWRSKCSTTDIRNFENETLKLYYYRAVRLLIQPYLEFLTPEEHLFRECQAAAGQICQLYKIFHQKTVNGHSTPAVHTVFGAGVSLIYCMWLERNFHDERRKKLGDLSKHTRPLVGPNLFSTMDDLRACSVCLYVMTERSKFARVFRDTFDQLMNATVGNLIERCGPDSSELIYLTDRSTKDGPVVLNEDIVTIGNSSKTLNVSLELHDAQHNISNNSGMPPAVARTFGKYQADEHVGFVENSQVDLEEQKKLRQRQGLLEQVAVPKSLAHLLINAAGSTSINNNTTVEAQLEPNAVLKIRSKDVGRPGEPRADDDDSKYIVQKPAYPNEFDWKNFQQQAFLQQQLAQQNLQAYLSSLNYSKSFGNVDTTGSVGTILKPELGQFNRGLLPAHSASSSAISILPGSNIISPVLSEIVAAENTSAPGSKYVTRTSSPTAPVFNYVAPGQNAFNSVAGNTDNNGNLIPNAEIPIITHDGSLNNMAATYIQSSNKPNSGSILFDNGTHEMINHISNWTSNAVGDLVNVFPSGRKEQQPNSSGTGGSQSSTNLVQNSVETSKFGFSNGIGGYETPRKLNNLDLNRQIRPIGSTAYPDSSVQNIPPRSVGTMRNIAPSNQAEEFWTINDDYGFLT